MRGTLFWRDAGGKSDRRALTDLNPFHDQSFDEHQRPRGLRIMRMNRIKRINAFLMLPRRQVVASTDDPFDCFSNQLDPQMINLSAG
jgi:hypothetical protein